MDFRTLLGTLFASFALAAGALQERDLPPGCNCTGVGCQYGIISDPPKGSLAMSAPNGTDMGNTGGPGFTVSVITNLGLR